MTSQTDLLRFGLAALLTGVAIPLAVQLFLVLRNVQKATATIDRRLDQIEAARDAFDEALRANDDASGGREHGHG